jgi:hypothetical protein
MSVRKKKEESFDWTPLKKITAFLIMSIVTAIGTYFGFNPEEKPKEEVSKIETPNGVNFSGNGNTNLNNSTINNVNNNTNNINNTNTIIKKEVIQPTQIIQKEIIIEKENTDDFGKNEVVKQDTLKYYMLPRDCMYNIYKTASFDNSRYDTYGNETPFGTITHRKVWKWDATYIPQFIKTTSY